MKNEEILFLCDGYTDIVGRFNYYTDSMITSNTI